jgi:hypothetical protein
MGEDWLDWRKTEHLTAGINEEGSVPGAWFDHFFYGVSLLFLERRIVQKNGVSFAIPLHSKRSGALSSLLNYESVSQSRFSLSRRKIFQHNSALLHLAAQEYRSSTFRHFKVPLPGRRDIYA